MARDFRLPDLGEGVHEGQVVRVLVKEGDDVAEDQPLMEVETDKAAVEIPSPYTGRVTAVHVAEQQVVNVGDVMISFTGDGTAAAPAGGATQAGATAAGVTAAAAGRSATTAPTSPGRRRTPASPAVRKLARSLGVVLDSIAGSGPGGRVTRADVESAAATGGAPGGPVPAPAATPVEPAPVVPAPTTGSVEPPGEAGQDAWGPVRRETMSRTRQTIAANMMQSWTRIPHVTDSFDADVTELDRLRRDFNEAPETGQRLTLLPFVLRAVAIVLQRHPALNASVDETQQQVVYKQYINLALGVHTDRGLIAPIIRDADRMGVRQLNEALIELAERARTARFGVNDLRGGTFTISNAGAMGGSRYSTPIINPPQVAVLALGRTHWQPMVVDGEVVPRFVMPISLSFDHRVIDGGTEIAFQADLVSLLEHPSRLLL
jgi:pyruvate dehydrogenase E2 component (dihydrolipoamide acetyltransferase)